MNGGLRENKERHLQDLFFADKSGRSTIDEDRQRELGKIIMEARNAVEIEIKGMEVMMRRVVFDDTLNKIRGACSHASQDEAVALISGIDEDNDMDEADFAEVGIDLEEKKSGRVKTVSARWHEILGLDDEEADLLDLLTGEREPRDTDVVLDEDLKREFKSLKRKEHYAVEEEIELAMSVMGLMVLIAKRSKFRNGHLMDLIQEAYRGALTAARKVDVEKFNSSKFATYAVWWIKQYVKKYGVNNIPEIRVPLHIEESRSRVGKAKHDIVHESFRPVHDQPELSEIAEKVKMSVQSVDKVLNLPYAEMVLDAPSKNDEGGGGMHDSLADKHVASPDYLVEKELLQRFLEKLLVGLKPIQRDVIEKRFGLNGHDTSQTLKEIGNGQRSRERIRQIEVIALNKLRYKISSMVGDEGGIRLDELI